MTDNPAFTESSQAPRVHINADAQQVWIMLREPAKIAQWHGWDAENLEQEIDSIFFTNSAEAPDHRSLTVNGGDTFLLEPEQGGTRVSVERAPMDSGSELKAWDEDITEGWTTFLQQLRFGLERHPNTPRRTVFFSGTAQDGQSIISKLGLDDVPAPGEEYSASLPTGVAISGKVWFRTKHQLGLTIHEYAAHGDGLLIVADQPVTEGNRPRGGSMAIASTFDLGAKAIHDIWQRWDEFRGVHYPGSDPIVTSELT